MAIAEIFSWWYSAGLAHLFASIKQTLISIADFFSMPSLIRTLFQPYRQISAARATSSASLSTRLHTWLDRLISRIIGFFARIFLLVTGSITVLLFSILSLVVITIWPLIPLFPVAGIALALGDITL